MTSPTRRRVLLSAGVVVVTLLAAEVGVRLLAPYLSQPDEWPDQATAVKVAQMDALGCADVVFVGNSMARDAFDPSLFTSIDGRTAYNASLDAASPAHLARWLPDQVTPRLEPATVVLALSSADLNDASAAGRAAFETYDASPGGRDDLLGGIQRAAADRVALVEHRAMLRDPREVLDAMSRSARGERADRVSTDGIDGVLGPLGQGLSRRELGYTGSAASQQFVADQLLNDFSLDGAQVDAARELIAALHRDGREVILVILPVTDDYVSLHPSGRDDFDEYRALMADLATTTGAGLVDLGEGTASDPALATDAVFADTHHVNAAGSALVTELTATALTDSPSSCSNAP